MLKRFTLEKKQSFPKNISIKDTSLHEVSILSLKKMIDTIFEKLLNTENSIRTYY